MRELSIAEVARRAGGSLEGDGNRVVRGVASLETAGPDELSFVAGARYLAKARQTRAGAVLLPRSLDCALAPGTAAIRVDDPHVALTRVLPALYPEARPAGGVDPTARVAEDATLEADVRVEPFALIGAGCRIGRGSRIGAHTVVGEGCVIGSETILHAHVTLYRGVTLGDRCIVHSGARLGADGFGYALVDGRHQKVPQVGGCRIGNDVEVGANTTIDRGSVGDTIIGDGTKIDNLVQVGHNTRIGEHVIIIAQVGISGSTIIGDYAVLGGQSATSGHLSIGAGARVAGRAAVTADVAPGETVSGYPARPHRDALRAQAAVSRLPSLLKRVQELERRLLGRSREGSSGAPTPPEG